MMAPGAMLIEVNVVLKFLELVQRLASEECTAAERQAALRGVRSDLTELEFIVMRDLAPHSGAPA